VTPVADTRLAILDWGRTRYEPAWRAQESLVARRLAGEIPDTLIFTEHDPVYTVGLRSGAEKHLVWDADRLALSGIEVVKTNRGGDITYHGPGQIVVYPIVSLDTHRDLHAYLRFLEEVLIAALARFGLAAARRDGLTGIWIAERKLAAIGVSVRRWVACHGFALNVAPDLAHFTGIIPCGIAATDGTVTSLAVELTARGLSTPSHDEVRTVLAAEFTARWPGFIAPSSG
jgi:lipoyl(octanoyl) transferase